MLYRSWVWRNENDPWPRRWTSPEFNSLCCCVSQRCSGRGIFKSLNKCLFFVFLDWGEITFCFCDQTGTGTNTPICLDNLQLLAHPYLSQLLSFSIKENENSCKNGSFVLYFFFFFCLLSKQPSFYSQNDKGRQVGERVVRDVCDLVQRQCHGLQWGQGVQCHHWDISKGVVIQPQVSERANTSEGPCRYFWQ